ncbi:MAG: type I-E CRISPR-associated protein Cas7/Cse4/CasC [Corynebacterium sp.]|nr:type I-E CRISPR-associated protein Cas7/Cse4/CasC [Corynebacterium sp.]
MTIYIDIHALQTVPPSNLNRDDTGSPKTANYGGVRRARVSSQAWKRAARKEFENLLDLDKLGQRTRFSPSLIAAEIILQAPELEESAEHLALSVLQKTKLKQAKPKKGEEDTRIRTEYLLFVSRAQIKALADLAIQYQDDPAKIPAKEAKEALNNEHSVDIALFGRMLADAPDLNVDATCQFNHAISVHPTVTEFDYFTAVDDNAAEDNAGAGMIGTVEFTSSTLYRYATVNASELAHSLGSKEAASEAAGELLKAFALSMPTGKQNTFANRTRPDLIVVQVRDDQPVNLSEAFEDPVEATRGRTENASIKLAEYAVEQDGAYDSHPLGGAYLATGGAATEAAMEKLNVFGDRTDMAGLVNLVEQAVMEKVEL